jgi:hypothetical protein
VLEILGYCDAHALCNIACSSRAVSEFRTIFVRFLTSNLATDVHI